MSILITISILINNYNNNNNNNNNDNSVDPPGVLTNIITAYNSV